MNDALEELAQDIATEVLHHMDTMYPEMWKWVPSTARLSVRNTIIRAVTSRVFAAGEEEKLS